VPKAAPVPKPKKAAIPTEPLTGPTGHTVRAFGPANEPYDLRYRLVPLDEPVVNHPSVQPRQRESRVTSSAQIARVAGQLNADRYLEGGVELDRGPAIVGPDRLVESGNARIAAIRYAREKHPETYKAFQAEQRARAAQFGFTPEQFDAVKNAVIVRERVTDDPDRLAFAEAANRPQVLAQAPAEIAATDARRMPEGAAARLVIGESQTLDQALQLPSNAQTVRDFLAGLDPNEIAGMVTADAKTLTPGGLQRVKAAIVQQVFPGEGGQRLVHALAESADSNVKNIETGIFGALGKLAQTAQLVRSGARPADLELGRDLPQVVSVLSRIRAQGGTVREYLAQQSLGARELDATQERLLELLGETRSSKGVRTLLNDYADLVRTLPEPEQGTLAGVPPEPAASKAQLLTIASQGPQISFAVHEPPAPSGLGERGGISPFAPSEAQQAFTAARAARVAAGTADPLETLQHHVEEMTPQTAPPVQRVKLAVRIAGARDNVKAAFERTRAAGAALWDAYRRPPPIRTPLEQAIKEYDAAMQVADGELWQTGKAIQKQFPDALRQEAMTNYLQAAGDDAALASRATASKGRTAQGYTVAQQLTQQETDFVQRVREYHDARLQQLIDAGMLEEGVENYVRQLYEQVPPSWKGYLEQVRSGALAPNPGLLKQRFYESYFEAEQAGKVPRDKRLGFLVGAYDHAVNKAILSQAFIKAIREREMAPDEPIVFPGGSGQRLDPPETATDVRAGIATDIHADPAYLIRAGTKPKNFGEYRPMNVAALRQWKWVAADENGAPILLQGDVYVHPAAYERLQRLLLDRSAIRRTLAGRVALRGVSEAKSFKLGFGGIFHQVNVGEHALEHGVNPFKAPPFRWRDPEVIEAMEGGLQLAGYNSLQAFSEGLQPGRLIERIPGLGALIHDYSEYLFLDNIPRLKMAMYRLARDRNLERYPKLTREQAVDLTAKQGNAAFGEENLRQLGRSATLQDMLRLLVFAPDFTISRAKFVGQALRPYGAEQRVALTVGAPLGAARFALRAGLTSFVMARVLNMALNDGDPHWEIPFGVKSGDQIHNLRTLQGDVLHFATDWNNFVMHRLTMLSGTAMEALSRRDERGERRNMEEQAKDALARAVPMLFDGLRTDSGRTNFQAMLQLFGIQSYRYRTPAERTAGEAAGRHVGDMTAEERAAWKSRRDIREHLRVATPEEAAADLARRQLTGEITAKQATALRRQSQESNLVRQSRHLPVTDLLEVWEKANPQERRQLRPIVQRRLASILPLADRLKLLRTLRPDLEQRSEQTQ